MGRTQSELEIGVDRKLDDDTLQRLEKQAGLRIRTVAVLSYRLGEALATYGVPFGDRSQWLVDAAQPRRPTVH